MALKRRTHELPRVRPSAAYGELIVAYVNQPDISAPGVSIFWSSQAMRNYYHWLGLTYVVTLATNPALSLPCGKDEHGMPFGLQVIGRLHGDARLLATAQALETGFADLPDLQRAVPNMQSLLVARPELKSIVTHPPEFGSSACAATCLTAV